MPVRPAIHRPAIHRRSVRLLAGCLTVLAAAAGQAQTIERVRLTDGELACAQIHSEIGNMDAVSKAMPPAASQALARKDFLTQLFVARGCKVSDLSFAGTPVTPETFRRLMSSLPPAQAVAASPVPAPPGAAPAAAAAADIQAVLQAPVTVLDAGGAIKGSAAIKGKRYYISEYRVMVEAGGSVTASTRAAYFGGTDYGATRMTVNYEAPQLDVAAIQAVVDRAYADFVSRLEAAGAKPEPPDAIIREAGVVYEASQDATRPGAPLVHESDLGYGKRRYMVFAPTGMKLNPRGFAGLGAGNISSRINYSKNNVEAISVVLAINLAAQESSGSGSSMFRRGSSANASAAMEVGGAPGMMLLQAHAMGQTLQAGTALPVPGQFATLRETGGYDTRRDAAVAGIQALGRMMGQAGNQSKRVDMALDVDTAALSRLALQGLVSVNQGIAAAVR